MKAYRWWAALALVAVLAVGVALVIWRGPDWHSVRLAFTAVSWPCSQIQMGYS